MANFNYKKYLTENKLTQTTKLRAGILAEGQFSWMTQDTNQQIGSQEENTIPVYMYDNEGNSYYESNYDGYGEFGGVDYYELLDKMNGGDGDRSRGINLAFEKIKTDSEILYPALVTKPDFNFKSHDFTQQPKNDPNQSWYMEPEEEDYNGEDNYDYSNDYDDNEGDGYIDDTDSEYDTGVDEGKKDDKKSNKMKRSELKEKIKEMALAEMKMKEDTYAPTSETDFLSEIEAMLAEDKSFTPEDDINFKWKSQPANPKSVITDTKSGERFYKAAHWEIDPEEGTDPLDILPTYGSENSDGTWTLTFDDGEFSGFVEGEDFTLGEEDDYDLDIEFKKAPNEASYNDVLDIMKSYEDESVLNDFKAEFSEGEPVNKKDYSDFAITLIDDMSEVSFIQANWISMFDEEVYDKAGLTEAEEEVDDTEVAVDGEENIDVDTTTEVDPNVKAVQDALTQAQAAAQKLGDPKLTDQIGNTITFFTRAHVVEKGAVAEGDLMKNIGKGLEYEATEEMIRDYAQHLMDEGSYDVEELAQSYLDIPRSFPKQLDYTFFKNNYDDILSVAMTGLDEGKTKDLNEAMFPMLKRILK
jgi:hypothetical protein